MKTPIGDGVVSSESGERLPVEGTLAELIVLEEEIEARVARAKDEAERVVADARQRAHIAEDDVAGSLEKATQSLRASIEQECSAAVRALAERAEADAGRYRDVDDATISRLSRWVASRVLRDSEST